MDKRTMDKRIICSILFVTAAMGLFLMTSLPTQGQDDVPVKGKGEQKGAKATSGPTPHTADGKVDLSGLWSPTGTSFTISPTR